MGKVKTRRRNNGFKSNSLQIPTADSPEPEVLSDEYEFETSRDNDSTIENILEQIQSANLEEKLCGLQSLVTLAEKSDAVDSIVQHNVIKVIAPFVVDKHSEVRNLTAGILRNLSASGSLEICERLVKEDIMTPLTALIQQYSDWKPAPNSVETDTLLQVVNILWNLCEADETALKYMMSANLLSVLLRCLDYKEVGLDLAIAVCQCLNAVSEDNVDVVAALRDHEAQLFGLLAVSSVVNKLLLLKAQVAGIIMNLNLSLPWLPRLLEVVQEVLTVDLRSSVSQLTSQLPLDSSNDLSADMQEQLDNAEALAEAQIMALEILTNLTSAQDDEMDVDSEDSGSEGEENMKGWSEADSSQILTLSPEISEGLEKFQLIPSVLAKIEPFPENVTSIVKSCDFSKNLNKKITRLHSRAFLCFNNLVPLVDCQQLGGTHVLQCLISKICRQWLLEPEGDVELLEAASAGVRAILLRLASEKFKLMDLSQEDLAAMISLGECPEPKVQANSVRIIGAFATLVVEKNPPIVKTAGSYLLEVAERELALWLTAEALDSLMDLFSDDLTDQIASEIGLVRRLEAIAPRLKTKMRKERKSLGEHYPVVSTVMTNIRPFIKYKSKRIEALK